MANTILLKGRGIRKEGVAGGTITPGDLITFNSAGALIRHATAKGSAAPLFAVENDLIGNEITDDYSTNDYVQSEYMHSGCEVLANVAASASAIVVGALLESDGSGGLRVLTAGSQLTSGNYTYTPAGVAIAQALEALDNSAGATRARIKVVIL